MQYKNNILETIGNTPLVRLNKIMAGIPALVLAKIETTNPGNSVKDRMAVKMIDDAEASGLLKPGGTIIECTSGNTGMGLAIAACVRGYRCIFTTSDKQSKEKVDMLKAAGAEVIVCPTNVEPTDPRSYYSVAERLNKSTPNSWWANQYDNLSNRTAHYESTGPEIWAQTEGKITHFVVGVGTGGTISGVAKYLKEQNPDVQIIGIDTYGSVFKKYHETGIFDEKEIYSYITEGIGEDILPKNVDFSLIDHFEKVSDKDAAIYTRKIAQMEGILAGNSAGSAVAGILQMRDRFKPTDVVVVLFHDHASRYVAKFFNDAWMRERGFLDDALTVRNIVEKRTGNNFFHVTKTTKLRDALQLMKDNDVSQLPVMEGDAAVGTLLETNLLNALLEHSVSMSDDVAAVMSEPLPMVDIEMPCDKLSHYMNKNTPAVLTRDMAGTLHVISHYDIIQTL